MQTGTQTTFTVVIVFNRLGGKSNTGEGGEDADRYTDDVQSSHYVINRMAANQTPGRVARMQTGTQTTLIVVADFDLLLRLYFSPLPGLVCYFSNYRKMLASSRGFCCK